MSATEIVLIVIGAVIFLLGYLIPARKKDTDEEVQLISEDEIRKMVSSEVEHVKGKISDIVEETVSYSIEKTERTMERVTNEKIMAINEYSDTVLEEINKNHKEVVFLYDMLNDKHDKLMEAVSEATQISDDVKQTLTEAELTVHEATDKADDVLRAVDEASARINDVLRAADDAVKGVWDAQNAARVAREAAQEAIRIASDLTGSKKEAAGTRVSADKVSAQTQQGQKRPVAGAVKQAVKTAAADKREITAEQKKSSAESIQTAVVQKPEVEPQVEKMKEPEGEPEVSLEQEFKPIMPRRVEIIHEPEEDFLEAQTPPMVDLQFDKDNGRNSNERILELHKAGKSNMAIAKELGLGLGEVKLVIDLFEGI